MSRTSITTGIRTNNEIEYKIFRRDRNDVSSDLFLSMYGNIRNITLATFEKR